MQYVDEIIQFMINKGVDVIVIACNTATSVAVKKMRTKYNIPIIGMEPAVKKAIDTYGYAKVLVVSILSFAITYFVFTPLFLSSLKITLP